MPTRRVQRVDRAGTLRSPHRRADGTVWVEGRAARAGVYEYVLSDGSTVRELIDEETLARVEDLATLGGVAVTTPHPPEDVRPETYDRYAGGHVSDEVAYEEEGGYVRVRMLLAREDTIAAADSGDAVELSCGYEATILDEPGEHPDHGPYDTRQIARRYNHVALVPAGRHGDTVRIRTDGIQRRDGANTWTPQGTATERTDMPTTEEIVAAIVPAVIAKMKEELSDMRGQLKDLSERMASEDASGSEEDAEEMEEDAEMSLEDRRAAARDRVALEDAAEHHKIDGYESMEDADLTRAVVLAERGDALEGADDATIRAAWMLLRADRRDASTGEGATVPAAETRTDSAPSLSIADLVDAATYGRSDDKTAV